MPDVKLEICVDDAFGLAAAIAGGADRIELCGALTIGGITPSAGLMELAAASGVPAYPMIRSRTALSSSAVTNSLFSRAWSGPGMPFGPSTKIRTSVE